MSTEQSDPWIGTTVDGRYQIEDRVARGGMSTVYLARDTRLGRPVALKVLFTHMAEDRKVVERFEQEARNSALISHPNVVQVLDQGQTRETAYLVMEHVPGATLRTLLKRGPMTPRLALTYAEAILQGLGAAHRAGLVHRDIKPENVLVSKDGRIKLADFGLARAATHHSGTSTLMGTVAYISPELLSGEGADERSDVYAVGILLYEMLTGVQPYTGESPVRVAFQHVNSTVPAPSAAVAGIAPALDEIVRAATSPRVEERPKSGDEMLELVNRCRAQLTDDQLDFMRPQNAAGAPADESGDPTATAALDLADSPEDGTTDDPVDSRTVAVGRADAVQQPGDTAAPTAPEEFPTTVEADPWDDEVAAALLHARSGATLDEADRQTVAEVPTEAFRTGEARTAEDQGPAERQGRGDAASNDGEQTGEAPTHAIAWGTDARPQTRTRDPRDETTEFSAVEAARPGAAPAQESIGESGAASAPTRRGPGQWVRRHATRAESDRRRRQRPTVELVRSTPTRMWLTVAVIMICSALVVLFAWYLGLSPDVIPSLGAGSLTPQPLSTPGPHLGEGHLT